MYENNTKVFFHLPKTAGTNLYKAIYSNYPKSKFKRIKERFVVDGAPLYGNLNPKNDERVINIHTKKTEFVIGHFAFQGCFTEQNPVIIIMFRDPVERVISQYAQNKRKQKTPNAKFTMKNNFTIEEYFFKRFSKTKLTSETIDWAGFNGWQGNVPWTHDFYCNALSGESVASVSSYPMKEAICNNIITNLKNNQIILTCNGKSIKVPLVVGITERFLETMNYLARIFNWKNKDYNKLIVKHGKSRKYNASPALLEAIRKANIMDIKIYKAALKTFDKQLKG